MPVKSPSSINSTESVLLSHVESYFWRFETEARAFRVAVLVRLEGCIEANFLEAALGTLQQRHPKLRAVICEGIDRRLRYRVGQVTRPIPFEIIDYSGTESPWKEQTRRLICTEYPPEGPLAAVLVLRNRSRGCSDLVFSATHGFTDGLSAIALLDELLAAYANAESSFGGPPQRVLPIISPRRAKSSGGWDSRLHLLRRFKRLTREVERPGQTSFPEGHNVPLLSQWVHWVFSGEETKRLIRRCRREQTSINGALMAAIFCAAYDCLGAPDALFTWQSPLNMRELLEGRDGPVTAEDLGCFVSTIDGIVRLTERPVFWDLARKQQQETQAFRQLDGPSFVYNLAAFLDRLTAVGRFLRLPRKWLRHRTPRRTLLVTNYGLVRLRNEYGCLHPRACTLTLRNDNAGHTLVAEALVLGQEMNIGLSAHNLDPAFWDRLQVTVRMYLDAAAAHQDEPAVQRIRVAAQE